MKIYTTPFLTYWPIPLAFKEFLECFKIKESAQKIKTTTINRIKKTGEKLSLDIRYKLL